MLLLASCSETKYVAEGELLLDKVKVKSDVKDGAINTTELKSFVRQRGNSRWFSLVKVPLYTYSLSGRDTTKWMNRTLRSVGEAPQLFDTLQTRLSLKRLQEQLQNMGYLRATVDLTKKVKGKKVNTGHGNCQASECLSHNTLGTAQRYGFRCSESGWRAQAHRR